MQKQRQLSVYFTPADSRGMRMRIPSQRWRAVPCHALHPLMGAGISARWIRSDGRRSSWSLCLNIINSSRLMRFPQGDRKRVGGVGVRSLRWRCKLGPPKKSRLMTGNISGAEEKRKTRRSQQFIRSLARPGQVGRPGLLRALIQVC